MASATAWPARLFVYGTLQPGRLRWPVLEPFALGHRPAEVPGALYDTGWGWPIASFGTGRGIPGTLVELDPARLTEALALLDEVEAAVTDLLVRIRVTTADGVEAWTYHCAIVPPSAVAVAVWDAVDER